MSINSSMSTSGSSSSTKSRDVAGLSRQMMRTRYRSSRIKDHKCELMTDSTHDINTLYPLSYLQRKKLRISQTILVSGSNRRCQKYLRSSAAVCFEEERQLLSPYWFVVHPFSELAVAWQWIMSVVLFGYVMYQPWVLAFIMTQLGTDYHFGWYFPNHIMDVMLFLDIGMSFITGIIAERTKQIILDPWVISRTYLRGHFLWDLITALPWDVLVLLVPDKTPRELFNILIFSSFEMLLNFYRVLHLIRLLRDLFDVIGFGETTYHLTYLLLLYMVYLHWAACAEFIVPFLIHADKLKDVPNSWIVDYGLLEPGILVEKYMAAITRVFSVSMSLGYGRFTKEETVEDSVVSTITLIIGFFYNALIFGVFLHFLTSRYSSDLKYQSTMIELQEYMRFKKLSSTTKERMLMYYENKYQKGYFNESAIMATLSGGIREQIYMHCCQRLLSDVELFRDLPPDVLVTVIASLHQEIFLPTDVITKAGMPGDCMYLLQNGTVAVHTATGKEVCHLQDGDYFGEIALLDPNGRRVASVIAVDICDMYRLDRNDFRECIASQPELLQQIEERARTKRAEAYLLEEEYKGKLVEGHE